MRRVLLTIGGLDPSGGAGILADLRAARAVGVETVSVLSALTAQSSARLLDVRPVPAGWIRAQIRALEGELSFAAVKTGLFASRMSIIESARWYRASGAGPLVVDPILATGDGKEVLGAAARRALVEDLFPLAALVTPNRFEAETLAGFPIRGEGALEEAARTIAALGPRAVLVKGGHFAGPPIDLFWDGRRARTLRGARRRPGRWHGLGCHLGAAIAARLAKGDSVAMAVARARSILARGMARATVTPSGRLVPRWGTNARS